MQVHNFSNYNSYTKLYESKLNECLFLTEQNISVNDIINPLENLITEEFINKFINKISDSKFGKNVKDIYTNVKTAVVNYFNGVVNFFKNFSFSKLMSGIMTKLKEIGAEAWKKVKVYLSSMNQFIIQNNMVDPETGKPNFKNIWSVLCNKAKSIVDMKEAGLDDSQLQSVGSKIQLNEADKFDIGDDEVKYYGFFEKVAHALGIKNARFNGVVSQIMKKGTIGLIIIGLMKMAGLSLAGLAIANPIALAVIGGMLLMAGLIILTIWICKPYPTVDDCLSYLHMYFGGNLQRAKIDVVFTDNWRYPYEDENKDKDNDEIDVKPIKSMYPVMIKNLKALQSMLISFDGVTLEGDKGSKVGDLKFGGKNKKGDLFKKKSKVKESLFISKFHELILEKEFTKQPRNVNVTKAEDYLTQAFNNMRKSIKVIKDEKDKGIGVTEGFIGDILDKKMDAKDTIKSLYFDIYDHIYGKYAKTIPDLGSLYKESIDVISKADKRKVVAEKIARLAKRTMQFEGEGFYSGLGEFGADMEEFNTTLKQIMESIKLEK